MNSAAVKVRPGDKSRLSKSDPDDTSKTTKEEACARFVDLGEKISRKAKESLALPARPKPSRRWEQSRMGGRHFWIRLGK